jgi:hypothetical protein
LILYLAPAPPVVAGRVQSAEAVGTALMTYAEARAAFARHRRDGTLSPADLRRAVRELEREWGAYNIVDLICAFDAHFG